MKAIYDDEKNSVQWICESSKEADAVKALRGRLTKYEYGAEEHRAAIKGLQRLVASVV